MNRAASVELGSVADLRRRGMLDVQVSGSVGKNGPDLPFSPLPIAAVQLHQTGHSKGIRCFCGKSRH